MAKRCRICQKKAFIYLRYANLALCKEHFIQRTEKVVKETIEKFKMFSSQDKILVAVSGGKDSLVLWHILGKLGFKADGVHLDLGIGEFSSLSLKLSQKFSETHQFNLKVVSAKEVLGASLEELFKKSKEKPCSLCGTVKRHLLNEFAYKEGYSVLLTGHHLDDETARLLGNLLNWEIDYIWRQFPVLPQEGRLIKRAKPLVFLSKKEIETYAQLEGIEYLQVKCPYSRGSKLHFLSDIMDEIEKHFPSSKLRFLKGFYKLRRIFYPKKPIKLFECPSCKMPTTSEGLCRFCRLKERISHGENFKTN